MQHFGESLTIQFPASISDYTVKDIYEDSIKLGIMLQSLPISQRDKYTSFVPSHKLDVLKWTGDINGSFSTKSFRESFVSRHAPCPWSKIIWQRWIPPKVTCFVWRMCYKGIPTDDRIRKLSIPITSRCVCCDSNSETLEHLFFEGKWASDLWSFLHNIFDIPMPVSLNAFISLWLGKRHPKTIIEPARLGAACFGVWEIGRRRNDFIHGRTRKSIIHLTREGLRKVSHLFKFPRPMHDKDKRRLQVLGIEISSDPFSRGRWRVWSPASSD